MSAGSQNPMECSRFEALLPQAAEGALAAAEMQEVRGHASTCATCGPLLREASAGRGWLRQLEPAEPPAELMRNILAATSYADPALRPAPRRAAESWRERLRPLLAPMAQPRLAGTFAMAFFSIALLLNIMGVHLTDVRNLDLRPHSVRLALTRTYYSTSARVVKYYDSMRFVYEVESRLRDLRNALPQQQQNPPAGRQQPKSPKKDHSIRQDPAPEQPPLYVDAGEPVLASFAVDVTPALQFSPCLNRRNAGCAGPAQRATPLSATRREA